jgi:hypothetical protein
VARQLSSFRRSLISRRLHLITSPKLSLSLQQLRFRARGLYKEVRIAYSSQRSPHTLTRAHSRSPPPGSRAAPIPREGVSRSQLPHQAKATQLLPRARRQGSGGRRARDQEGGVHQEGARSDVFFAQVQGNEREVLWLSGEVEERLYGRRRRGSKERFEVSSSAGSRSATGRADRSLQCTERLRHHFQLPIARSSLSK